MTELGSIVENKVNSGFKDLKKFLAEKIEDLVNRKPVEKNFLFSRYFNSLTDNLSNINTTAEFEDLTI